MAEEGMVQQFSLRKMNGQRVIIQVSTNCVFYNRRLLRELIVIQHYNYKLQITMRKFTRVELEQEKYLDCAYNMIL